MWKIHFNFKRGRLVLALLSKMGLDQNGIENPLSNITTKVDIYLHSLHGRSTSKERLLHWPYCLKWDLSKLGQRIHFLTVLLWQFYITQCAWKSTQVICKRSASNEGDSCDRVVSWQDVNGTYNYRFLVCRQSVTREIHVIEWWVGRMSMVLTITGF